MPTDHSEEEARSKMLASFGRLVAKGYSKKPDEDATGFPVAVVHGEEVPIRGNVHIGLGRTVSRAKINSDFSK